MWVQLPPVPYNYYKVNKMEDEEYKLLCLIEGNKRMIVRHSLRYNKLTEVQKQELNERKQVDKEYKNKLKRLKYNK